MKYDFDKYYERRNTNSLKYDFATERGRPADVLPLWVADMDFPGPEPVNEALVRAARFGIYGYSEVKQDYTDAVTGWFDRRFGWKPEAQWLEKTPGVVFAIAAAIRALTKEGESVLIQTPVYYPFYEVIRDNGRKIVENPLKPADLRYEIDFEDFEKKIKAENVKLFILCSPHNPVGRVWTEEELKKLAEICERYGVYVVSDEIHCDIILPGHAHTPFLKAAPGYGAKTIVCTAPSKSFNLAGLQTSNIFIPDEDVRRRFRKEIDRTGYSQLNTMGLIACKEAYLHGEEWLTQCLEYLKGNLDLIKSFLAENLPELKLTEPEGTYFAWVDFSGLFNGEDKDRKINDLVINKAKLWLDAGPVFGKKTGSGYQRIAYATRRDFLEYSLRALARAVRE